MTRAAAEVMQEVLVAAVLDALGALRANAKGVPNTLLREIQAIHANTTFGDLPAEVQASLQASVRAAFTRLLKEGYSVSPAGSAPPRPTSVPRREGHGHRPGGPGGHRGPQPGIGQPPRGPRTGPGAGRPGGGKGPRPKK